MLSVFFLLFAVTTPSPRCTFCALRWSQRLIHGGVKLGERKTWTLCNSQEEEDFTPLVPEDSPYILMVDRGECTFASKVCSSILQPHPSAILHIYVCAITFCASFWGCTARVFKRALGCGMAMASACASSSSMLSRMHEFFATMSCRRDVALVHNSPQSCVDAA